MLRSTEQPLISAIVIFFNEEQFLREAIESVFAQTWRNWELLLVDDGSTDGSAAIARDYAERHPEKVRILHHPQNANQGSSAARNLGMRNARGEYIALLDGDDVWLPDALERHEEILRTRPNAGMVYGACQWWFSWSRRDNNDTSDYTPGLGAQAGTLFDPPALLTMFLQGQARVPCTCSVLFRRELMQITGGFEEQFRGLYDDQAFYAKICLKTPVFVSGACSSRYRQHSDSLCSVSRNTAIRDSARLFYLDWLEQYLSSERIKDQDLWQALKRKQFRHRHPSLYRMIRNTENWVARPAQELRAAGRRFRS